MLEFLARFETVWHILLGAGLSLLMAHIYYGKATKDLAKVSKHLHEAQALTMKALESGGSFSWTLRWDKKTGEPVFDQIVRLSDAFDFKDRPAQHVDKADDSKDEDDDSG